MLLFLNFADGAVKTEDNSRSFAVKGDLDTRTRLDSCCAEQKYDNDPMIRSTTWIKHRNPQELRGERTFLKCSNDARRLSSCSINEQ